MIAAFRHLSGLLPLAVAVVAAAQAPLPPERPVGKIVILDNDRVLEGDVEIRDQQYRLVRPVGELWLPTTKVKHLAGNWEEALAYMAGKANLRDPDERLRLARWCHQNGQYELALREARAALALRPEHLPTKQLAQMLDRQLATLRQSVPTSATPVPSEEELPAIAISGPALSTFTSRVQPILMNVCASCHAGDRGGKFRLQRVWDSQGGNRRGTLLNLAAVLGQMRRERPETSPLLEKAILAHGRASQPPIKNRQAPPYRILEEWVLNVAPSLPSRDEPSPLPATATGTSPRADSMGSAFSTQRSGPLATALPTAPSTNSVVVASPPAIAAPAPDPLPPGISLAPSPGLNAPPTLGTVASVVASPAQSSGPPTIAPAAPSRTTAPPGPATESPVQYAPGDQFSPVPFNERYHPGR